VANATLETERLRLDPLNESDIDPLHAVLREEGVRRYLLDGEEVERDWVAEVVGDSVDDFASKGLGLWAIRKRDAPRLLGMTGYRSFFEPPVEELLYALHPDAWGQGIAGEAAGAAIAHAFEVAGRERIRASTDEPNEASLRLMLLMGFVETRRDQPAECKWEQIHCTLERAKWAGTSDTGQ
jgi:ribosomal-protein-alanine N-acetyltransferase